MRKRSEKVFKKQRGKSDVKNRWISVKGNSEELKICSTGCESIHKKELQAEQCCCAVWCFGISITSVYP